MLVSIIATHVKYVATALLVVLLGLSGRLIDFPRLAGGFKGDEATYVLMAFSFADDLDMKYTNRDLLRFFGLSRDEHHPSGVGPDGIFIKKGSRIVGWKWAEPFSVTAPIAFVRDEVPTTQSIEYGKAFAYPLFAAPFAKLGGLGGMFVFNVLLLVLCTWLGALFLRAHTGSFAGAAFGAVFVLASVMPVWTTWLTPEVFNFSLVFVAYFLWLYKEVIPKTAVARWWQGPWSDLLAALLIGVVTFSKPNHALMIAPIGLLMLWRLQIRKAILVGAVFVAGAAACYGANLWSTGEWNYQGSVYTDGRISCYGTFPFDGQGTPFAVSQQCASKVTNEANSVDEQVVQFGVVPTRAMFPLFVRNAYYFVVGRDAGFLPFFFPGLVVIIGVALRFWEIKRWQWLTLGIVFAQAWALLALAPWTWNGDGGPPGNRYFLSVYPALLFVLPSSARWGTTALAMLVGGFFTGSMTLSPFVSAKQTWLAVQRAPLIWLPPELTIMNALPVRLLDGERARIKWEHDIYVQFYYMDDNTHGVDYNADNPGLWMRGASTAEIVVKAEYPLTRVSFKLASRVENDVKIEMGAEGWAGHLKPDVSQTFEFQPNNGVWSKDGWVYVMRLRSSNGFYPNKVEPGSTDNRYLGMFVTPTFYDGRVK